MLGLFWPGPAIAPQACVPVDLLRFASKPTRSPLARGMGVKFPRISGPVRGGVWRTV
jgi:hypothetical protein